MPSSQDRATTKDVLRTFIELLSMGGLVYGTVFPLLDALRDKDHLSVAVYVLLWCVAGAFLWQMRPKRKPDAIEDGVVFQGVRRLAPNEAWPRSPEARALRDFMIDAPGHVALLVGQSGVGKSTLVRSQLLPLLGQEGWDCLVFDNYEAIRLQAHIRLQQAFGAEGGDLADASALLTGIPTGKKVVLVFDQLESLLPSSDAEASEHECDRAWFREFLIACAAFPHVVCLLVTRREYYFDLRFLGGVIPAPARAFELRGLDGHGLSLSKELVAGKLLAVTRDQETTKVVLDELMVYNELLPVEVQIVGTVLEAIARRTGSIRVGRYRGELGGKTGLIRQFFLSHVTASPDEHASLTTLLALSVETRRRVSLSPEEIAAMTHRDVSDVLSALSFFVKHELVIERGAGHYEWSHDYLAESFRELSGSQIDPVERDNILYAWDCRKESVHDFSGKERSRSRAGSLMLAGLAALLVVRLLGPAYGVAWSWFNALAGSSPSRTLVDTAFLPAFLSHLAWSTYVGLLFDRLLVRLREGVVGRVMSYATLAVCVACVVLAVMAPRYWLISIAGGGIMVGLKFVQLSLAQRKQRMVHNVFRQVGLTTLVNCIIVLVLGVAYRALVLRLAGPIGMSVGYLLMMVMVYFAAAVGPRHASESSAARLQGLYERGQGV